MSEPSGGESRKTVTVVFSDVAESTRLGGELDPETTRHVMSRYFRAASDALSRHGGTVEKFIGDAVMAVFGIPTAHEDDALRAVRAVADLHGEVLALNERLEVEHGVRISVRSGVNTGEVVAGDADARQMLVTGDAVNVAARLESAAAPGEALIGASTKALVQDAARLEEVAPLELRGKEQPVRAWRLVEVLEDRHALGPRFDSPLVGRARELVQVEQSFELAVDTRSTYLFTLIGTAGVGKSRLAAELRASVSSRARVLSGRCLPYGDGITYWPLFEIVRELVGGSRDDRTAIAEEIAGEEAADEVSERVVSLFRAAEPASAEEAFWAARKLFEGLARAQPLVLIIDDIHWAEPTLLDLLDHVAEWSRDVPIFLLCLARPDLLDHAPTWAGGRVNATMLMLRPLDDAAANELIDNLLGHRELSAEMRRRITAAADGNPLFVEQMVAMLDERSEQSGFVVPPTIQALLAARLDQLETDTRAVLERASVVGRRFWVGAVAGLFGDQERPEIVEALELLVRKELLRPGAALFPNEQSYRFRHQLIRDAAYAGVSKELRAQLHERFADSLEERAGERVAEVEAIVGYHLEQAVRYRRELRRVDEHGRELAIRASERLASAGRRALAGGDTSAATTLLERAVRLLPPETPGRGSLLVDLGATFVVAGELARAEQTLSEAIEVSVASGERRTELHALLERALLRALTDPGCSGSELLQVAEAAVPELEKFGDERGLAKAWRRIADVHWLAGHWVEQERALERATGYATRAGDAREAAAALMRLPMAVYYGPTPVPDAIRRAETIRATAHGARVVEATTLACLAGLHAMIGEFERARELLAEAEDVAEKLGYRVWLAGFSLVAADIESLGGDSTAAEPALRRAYGILEAMGERGLLAQVSAALACALLDAEQKDEAERYAEISEKLASNDVASGTTSRALRARLLAEYGDTRGAQAMITAAVRLAETSDNVNLTAGVLVEQARVLAASDEPEQARISLKRAAELYACKQNTVALETTLQLEATLASAAEVV